MVAAAVIGAAVIGGVVGVSSSKRGAAATKGAAEAGILEQRAAREAFEARTEPFRALGVAGAEQLTSFLQDPSQALDNPVANFLRDQGFEQIQESAAARGRLGAGGTLQDLSRFQTNLAGTLQNQRFNQLFNVAGLGANVAAGQGTAALQTGTNIANLLGVQGQAQAAGIAGQAQAITGTLQNITGAFGAFPNLFGGQTSAPVVSNLSQPAAAVPPGQPAPVVDLSSFGQ